MSIYEREIRKYRDTIDKLNREIPELQLAERQACASLASQFGDGATGDRQCIFKAAEWYVDVSRRLAEKCKQRENNKVWLDTTIDQQAEEFERQHWIQSSLRLEGKEKALAAFLRMDESVRAMVNKPVQPVRGPVSLEPGTVLAKETCAGTGRVSEEPSYQTVVVLMDATYDDVPEIRKKVHGSGGPMDGWVWVAESNYGSKSGVDVYHAGDLCVYQA